MGTPFVDLHVRYKRGEGTWVVLLRDHVHGILVNHCCCAATGTWMTGEIPVLLGYIIGWLKHLGGGILLCKLPVWIGLLRGILSGHGLLHHGQWCSGGIPLLLKARIGTLWRLELAGYKLCWVSSLDTLLRMKLLRKDISIWDDTHGRIHLLTGWVSLYDSGLRLQRLHRLWRSMRMNRRRSRIRMSRLIIILSRIWRVRR